VIGWENAMHLAVAFLECFFQDELEKWSRWPIALFYYFIIVQQALIVSSLPLSFVSSNLDF
jgi:hypothetical protein